MDAGVDQGRRTFIKVSALAAGGLLIGFRLPVSAQVGGEPRAEAAFAPNAWIRIDADGVVTVLTDRSEMGQGVMTALPMLVAEELEVELARVRTQWAPADPAYVNPLLGSQATGGSTSVRAAWKPLREAGAVARELLIAAAAQTWGVSEQDCRARDGAVEHAGSGRRLTYGELAAKAATLPVPKVALLKDPGEFRLLGKPAPRLDVPEKVDGSARFGIDVRRPKMLTAVVARPPVFGARVSGYDAAAARRQRGVREVVQVDGGVAVVAEDFWQAQRARAALSVRWDAGAHAKLDSAAIRARFAEAAKSAGAQARRDGDPEGVLRGAVRRLRAVYEVPYQAHATMEPMNCTAHVQADRCDVWVPTQAQGSVQQTAAKITGLPAGRVHVHTTFLGGGFGRRFEQDFVTEAVQISKAVRAPVQVVWTREDDMRHDYYRPATYNVLTAGLDKRGRVLAWTHRTVGPSIMSRAIPKMVQNGIDPSSVEGAANLPYAIPNIHVDYVTQDVGVPVGFWRSVGNSQNGFVTECFLDEIAQASKTDPYALRRALLKDAPRHRRVLELAAQKAGWEKRAPRGRHRGIAVMESFGSYVAQVAEVSYSPRAGARVHRVVCAVDCGVMVNPDTVRAQMESAVAWGLTATLKGAITLADGAVVQGNFDDYPLLRFDEMPDVEVHFVETDEAPGGVGEPGVPPLAPAVANALFAASGRRVRHLPIAPADLRTSPKRES